MKHLEDVQGRFRCAFFAGPVPAVSPLSVLRSIDPGSASSSGSAVDRPGPSDLRGALFGSLSGIAVWDPFSYLLRYGEDGDERAQ